MKQNVYDYSYEMRRMRKHRITVTITVFVSVVLFMSLFLNFVLFPVRVSSSSMESDIVSGGAVFVTPLVRNPGRGDVVYLSRLDREKVSLPKKIVNTVVSFFTAQQYAPFGYTTNMTGKPVLRRVVGLPGDKIKMKDYLVYVKPQGSNVYLTEYEMASSAYDINIYRIPAEWDGIGSWGNMDEITLGEDEYFVLADNRIEGTDSRVWGPVEGSRIQGRAILQYFPFSKIRHFF